MTVDGATAKIRLVFHLTNEMAEDLPDGMSEEIRQVKEDMAQNATLLAEHPEAYIQYAEELDAILKDYGYPSPG